MAPSRFCLTQNVTISWPGVWSELIQGAPAVPVTAPAVPATGVAAFNNTGTAVAVTVTGGTVTAVTVNGTQVASSTPATVIVPYPGTISVTYSALPSWSWAVAELAQSGSSSMTAAVSGTAPPGGQVGTLPQYTFQRGMVITADSAAIPAGQQGTGPQQLYMAIGGSNLTAWRDGTDVVGHAALSN